MTDKQKFVEMVRDLLNDSMSSGFEFDVKDIEATDDGVLVVTTKADQRFQIVVSKVVCAWCPDFKPTDEANRDATHGMCSACKAKMEASS